MAPTTGQIGAASALSPILAQKQPSGKRTQMLCLRALPCWLHASMSMATAGGILHSRQGCSLLQSAVLTPSIIQGNNTIWQQSARNSTCYSLTWQLAAALPCGLTPCCNVSRRQHQLCSHQL